MNLQTTHKIYTPQDFSSVKTNASVLPMQKKQKVNLSTMHKSTTTDATPKQKPDYVNFENHHKVGVDCVDMMVKKYSTKQPFRRCRSIL